MTTLKGISALGIDRDLGFSQAQQGYRPHDDGDNEVNDDEVDDNDKDDNNNKDGNNNKDDKGISALGLDRDLRFSRGHQGHQVHRPPDDDEEDDDEEVEDKNEVEDNDKDDNDKDDNNFKDISALGLYRDLEFSRGHPTKSTLTIPNQTQTNQTIPNDDDNNKRQQQQQQR